MNSIVTWLATKFVGKKTYATLAVLAVKKAADYFGVTIDDAAVSTAVDVLLILAAAVFRRTASVEGRVNM